MKKFEKQLKMLIEKSDGGCMPVDCSNGVVCESDLRFLKSKDLISMQPAGDNEFFAIVTSCGLTYFLDKQAAKLNFWKNYILKFLSGVAAGVISTLLVEHVILPLLSKVQ